MTPVITAHSAYAAASAAETAAWHAYNANPNATTIAAWIAAQAQTDAAWIAYKQAAREGRAA